MEPYRIPARTVASEVPSTNRLLSFLRRNGVHLILAGYFGWAVLYSHNLGWQVISGLFFGLWTILALYRRFPGSDAC